MPNTRPLRRRGAPVYPTVALIAALTALGACSDDSNPVAPTPDPVETGAAVAFQRLLVADATAPTARLLSLSNDATVSTFQLAGPASLVYRTHSGRFAVVQQRDANRVNFFDAGVWTDGAMGYRRDATRLGFELTDGLPTHESVNGNWISIFMDGNGRAVWLNENDKIAGAPRVAFEVQTGGAHHSGSATFTVNGAPYLVVAPLNPAGGLPNSVEVRNQQGQVIASVPDCPSMHGNNAISGGVVFGCQDGMVLVRANGGQVAAEKIVPSGDMAGLGLRNAYSASGASFILGQFSALPGQPTQRVLATINPVTGAIGRLPALPDADVDHWRSIEPTKGQIVLLGRSGSLYVYDAATRALQHTVRNVVPAIPASGATTHQVDTVEDLAAVASPTTGEVVLVNIANGTVIRRINVGGAPSRLTITGARRNGTFALAQ